MSDREYLEALAARAICRTNIKGAMLTNDWKSPCGSPRGRR
jgi:hypothetical protein